MISPIPSLPFCFLRPCFVPQGLSWDPDDTLALNSKIATCGLPSGTNGDLVFEALQLSFGSSLLPQFLMCCLLPGPLALISIPSPAPSVVTLLRSESPNVLWFSPSRARSVVWGIGEVSVMAPLQILLSSSLVQLSAGEASHLRKNHPRGSRALVHGFVARLQLIVA